LTSCVASNKLIITSHLITALIIFLIVIIIHHLYCYEQLSVKKQRKNAGFFLATGLDGPRKKILVVEQQDKRYTIRRWWISMK